MYLFFLVLVGGVIPRIKPLRSSMIPLGFLAKHFFFLIQGRCETAREEKEKTRRKKRTHAQQPNSPFFSLQCIALSYRMLYSFVRHMVDSVWFLASYPIVIETDIIVDYAPLFMQGTLMEKTWKSGL